MVRTSIEDRFWARVNKRDDGCWLWTGSARSGGYGVFHDGQRSRAAHRYSWELAYGALPETSNDRALDGFSVAHTCGNPRCVRPEHLHLVSRGDRARGGRRIVMLPFDQVASPERHWEGALPGAVPSRRVSLVDSILACQDHFAHQWLEMSNLERRMAWVQARIRAHRVEGEGHAQQVASPSNAGLAPREAAAIS